MESRLCLSNVSNGKVRLVDASSSPRIIFLLLRSTSPRCRSYPEVVLHCCHDLLVLVLVDVILLLLLCAILALCSLVPSGQACHIVGMLCSCCFLFLLICCSFLSLCSLCLIHILWILSSLFLCS